MDAYLRGHSDFTAQLAVLLARQLGRDDPETLATLRTAAKLSQLGMIQLPKELLTKSGSLTPDERAQLERHVDYAREALAGIDFGLPVLEAMTQMHERLDGSGYPDHLQGENICPNARILAVANTFCAWSVPLLPHRLARGRGPQAAQNHAAQLRPTGDRRPQTILGTDRRQNLFHTPPERTGSLAVRGRAFAQKLPDPRRPHPSKIFPGGANGLPRTAGRLPDGCRAACRAAGLTGTHPPFCRVLPPRTPTPIKTLTA